MKKIFILIFTLASLSLQAQNVADLIRTTPVPSSGANKNNRATVDANLKAALSLNIPRAAAFTLNGAKDSTGYVMFNTTSNRFGVYRGSGVWDTYLTAADVPTNFVPLTGQPKALHFYNNSGNFVPDSTRLKFDAVTETLGVNGGNTAGGILVSSGRSGGSQNAITSDGYRASNTAGLSVVQQLGAYEARLTGGVLGYRMAFGSANVVTGNPMQFTQNVGIGTTPSAVLHALGTTQQLRLGYDATNYATFTVDATGHLTIGQTGGAPALMYFGPGVSGPSGTFGTISTYATIGNNAIDIAAGTVSLGSGFQYAGSTVNYGKLVTAGGNVTNVIPANANYSNAFMGRAGFANASTGTHAWMSNVVFAPIARAANNGATITNGANIYLTGAPTYATNNYALYSESGTNYFGGNVGVGVSPLSTFHVQGASGAQLRLSYDATNFSTFYVGTTGLLTVGSVGGVDFTPTVNFSGNTNFNGVSNVIGQGQRLRFVDAALSVPNTYTMGNDGAGIFTIKQGSTSNGLYLSGNSLGIGTVSYKNGAFSTSLSNTAGTANRTQTLQDKDGVIALLSDITGGSGTVTNVASGYGISGGPITTTGTLTADTTSSTALVSKTRLATNLGGYVKTTRTIAGFPLSSNVTLATLQAGYGTSFTNYDGSVSRTVIADTSSVDALVSKANLASQMALKAPIASPAFTGTVSFPTPFTLGGVSVTSTAAKLNFISGAAGTTGGTTSSIVFSNGPTLIGTPNAPTAAATTNTTQIATTAFVKNQMPLDNVLTKTANYTIVSGDFAVGFKSTLDLYVDATAGNVTITLPSATTFAGYTIYVTKTDASANTVTINTVLGGNSLTSQYQVKQFNSNATSWYNH